MGWRVFGVGDCVCEWVRWFQVLALLQRFYDPKEGSIFVNGKDLKTIDVQATTLWIR